MDKTLGVILTTILMLGGVLLLSAEWPKPAVEEVVVEEKVELNVSGPTPLTNYGDDTIVPKHSSTCRYCQAKNDHSERRYGLYGRVTDELRGLHGHVHKCQKCGEKYVCDFHCTLSDSQIDHTQEGLRSREECGDD